MLQLYYYVISVISYWAPEDVIPLRCYNCRKSIPALPRGIARLHVMVGHTFLSTVASYWSAFWFIRAFIYGFKKCIV